MVFGTSEPPQDLSVLHSHLRGQAAHWRVATKGTAYSDESKGSVEKPKRVKNGSG